MPQLLPTAYGRNGRRYAAALMGVSDADLAPGRGVLEPSVEHRPVAAGDRPTARADVILG